MIEGEGKNYGLDITSRAGGVSGRQVVFKDLSKTSGYPLIELAHTNPEGKVINNEALLVYDVGVDGAYFVDNYLNSVHLAAGVAAQIRMGPITYTLRGTTNAGISFNGIMPSLLP